MYRRLAIGYGAATVRAVLVTGEGTVMLPLQGGPQMSAAAYVGDDGVQVGAAAWRQATADPDRFVVSPLRAGTGQLTVGGRQVEVADLVAASLRHVADTAAEAAGGPIEDVRLVVPAGWGPQRRTWLRHAARAARLNVTRLIEAPIAATRTATTAGPAGVRLVIDVGAGCEVTVVRDGPDGAEVLATLADPDAGGDRLDAVLLHALTGSGLAELPADRRLGVLASLRTARHALSEQIAVTMAMPGGDPPIVVSAAQLADAARPVFAHVGELAAKTLANADLTAQHLSGIVLIGAAAATPDAPAMIAATLGVAPALDRGPELAAVLGAADTTAAEGPEAGGLPLPPLRRLLSFALAGLASLGLYAHVILSAEFDNGTRKYPQAGYYVEACWGELIIASLLVMIISVQGASLLAAAYDHERQYTTPKGRESRITTGIGLAIAAGLAVASMYAIAAAVYFNYRLYPVSQMLHWTVVPCLPIAAAAATIAVIAWRRPTPPPGGWDRALTFPASSLAFATIGTVLLCMWWWVYTPWWFSNWKTLFFVAGGALFGVAIACTLVRHRLARIALAVPLAAFTAVISHPGADLIAGIYAVVVAYWWAGRAWTILRILLPVHERA